MGEAFRLKPDAYFDPDWLKLEQQQLFPDTWCFAGTVKDFAAPGDYRVVDVGWSSLAVILGKDGTLAAVHNFCRHRGAALFDKASGNAGSTIVCPYHRWTYGLDGALRGLPDRQSCFADLDRANLSLKPAAIGVFREFVFVNPNAAARFEDWIAPVADKAWPHDLFASDVKEAVPLIYDVKCNWKIFAENAVDGYHLAYLHEQTLGGPTPDKNVWERAGDHMVWYANEDGIRHRLPKKIRDEAGSSGLIKSASATGYGGVYFLFPLTLVVPTPFGLSVTSMKPLAPDRTRLDVRQWVGPWQATDERKYIPGYDKTTGIISSENWTQPPLETGDFQTEDIWICEKVQRGLEMPGFEFGPLSRGPGAEDPIRWFHESLHRTMKLAQQQDV
ncbi:aromatic ring-hydroxylating dioxygenase subunit alpha [Roseibium sp. MMSF_3544]|uniref:aromatic ring-hydroxylating oxygenase subunit alpha n=1 Tax=unclassified Roseibium TaxID=2629323 RepID=UPI00273FD7C2|nr:aromatic ring-hydroxylating dioxygenase subunit alpha [Roseibium sp. MMSF_3544]